MIAQTNRNPKAAAARPHSSDALGPTSARTDSGPDRVDTPEPASILVPGLTRTIEVKIASEREEFEQAFQLLAENYQSRGYEAPSTKLFRFTPFHVLPETVTFVAKHGERVVATLSLVPDTTLLGLPMESIYAEELAEQRLAGRRMAEVTSLADRDLCPREFLRVFTTMIKLMCQYHRSRGGDSWVITVNPRHSRCYRKVLGFVPLGPRKSYPTVQGHPAEAYLLQVEAMRRNAPAKYEELFGEALPASVLEAPERPAEHVHYFGEHSTQADRRTIMEILLYVERFGSPPRWSEGEARNGAKSFAEEVETPVELCGC